MFSIFAETISGDSLILDGKLLGACNSDLLPDIGLLLNMGRGWTTTFSGLLSSSKVFESRTGSL